MALAFAGSLVVGLAACGGGGSGFGSGSGQYGAIAASLNDCEGTSLGLAVTTEGESEAKSEAINQCRGADGTDCEVILTFGSAYQGDNQCGAAALGSRQSGCSVFGGSGGSESAAEEDALSRCGNRGYECRLPSSSDRWATCTN